MQRLRNLEKSLDRELDRELGDSAKRSEPSALQMAIDETTEEIRNAFKRGHERQAPVKAKVTLSA